MFRSVFKITVFKNYCAVGVSGLKVYNFEIYFFPVGTSDRLLTVILEIASHSITAMTTHPGE